MSSQLDADPLLRDVPSVAGWKYLSPAVLYSKVGQGGMGSVYRGRHLELDIDVAIKCLNPVLAATDAQFEGRFRREARLAAELSHENLVRLYELRHEHGLSYLVLEFVEGETARDRVERKGALREEEAAMVVLCAARGLSKAHRHREVVVHRDIKPENILVSRRGDVKLADLGIAKALEGETATFATQGAIGTPHYMAPEQWQDARAVGPAADVWSLGATLYFLLAGREAFHGSGVHQIGYRICNEPFPDVRAVRPEVSADLARILDRCTRRDPAERYADAAQLVKDLDRFVGSREPSLFDLESGTVQSSTLLVSPPPAQALRQIRLTLTGSATPRPPATVSGQATAEVATPVEVPPAPAPDIAVRERRRTIAILACVGLALVAVVTLLATRDAAAPEPPPVGRAPEGWRVVDATAGPGGWARRVAEPRLGITFVLIPPGTFPMGSPAGEEGRDADETLHPVELTRPYYLAETETTQAQYQAVMGKNPSTFRGPTLPVEGVTWDQASEFCAKLGLSLPTEAQWEHACRAGSTTPFSFGVTVRPDQASYDGSRAYGAGPKGEPRKRTVPVRTFASNAFGLHEMHGNVLEWCADGYRRDPEALPQKDPLATAGDTRVMRGGSWDRGPALCRSARRDQKARGSSSDDLGFRASKQLE